MGKKKAVHKKHCLEPDVFGGWMLSDILIHVFFERQFQLIQKCGPRTSPGFHPAKSVMQVSDRNTEKYLEHQAYFSDADFTM